MSNDDPTHNAEVETAVLYAERDLGIEPLAKQPLGSRIATIAGFARRMLDERNNLTRQAKAPMDLRCTDMSDKQETDQMRAALERWRSWAREELIELVRRSNIVMARHGRPLRPSTDAQPADDVEARERLTWWHREATDARADASSPNPNPMDLFLAAWDEAKTRPDYDKWSWATAHAALASTKSTNPAAKGTNPVRDLTDLEVLQRRVDALEARAKADDDAPQVGDEVEVVEPEPFGPPVGHRSLLYRIDPDNPRFRLQHVGYAQAVKVVRKGGGTWATRVAEQPMYCATIENLVADDWKDPRPYTSPAAALAGVVEALRWTIEVSDGGDVPNTTRGHAVLRKLAKSFEPPPAPAVRVARDMDERNKQRMADRLARAKTERPIITKLRKAIQMIAVAGPTDGHPIAILGPAELEDTIKGLPGFFRVYTPDTTGAMIQGRQHGAMIVVGPNATVRQGLGEMLLEHLRATVVGGLYIEVS